jgi:membrane protein DedA with SNARE-associated domain
VPLLAALVHIPANAGYSLVFALIAVETMGIPVPGETALITAALLAHDGEMSIELLIGLAAAAAILGDNIGFAWPRFLFWNALGGICWATTVGVGAYLVGHAFERVIGVGGVIAAGLVGGVITLLFLNRYRRERRDRRDDVDARMRADG